MSYSPSLCRGCGGSAGGPSVWSVPQYATWIPSRMLLHAGVSWPPREPGPCCLISWRSSGLDSGYADAHWESAEHGWVWKTWPVSFLCTPYTNLYIYSFKIPRLIWTWISSDMWNDFPWTTCLLRWVSDLFMRADKNKDGRISFKEVQKLLKLMNIDMNELHAHALFMVRKYGMPIVLNTKRMPSLLFFLLLSVRHCHSRSSGLHIWFGTDFTLDFIRAWHRHWEWTPLWLD